MYASETVFTMCRTALVVISKKYKQSEYSTTEWIYKFWEFYTVTKINKLDINADTQKNIRER